MRARKALGETFYFEKAWKGGCWRSVAELVGWRVQHGEEGWREVRMSVEKFLWLIPMLI